MNDKVWQDEPRKIQAGPLAEEEMLDCSKD